MVRQKDRKHCSIQCADCAVSHLCIAQGLSGETLEQVNAMISKAYIVPAGGPIYHVDDEAEGLFAVHSGCCKDYFLDVNGKEYVNGFYLPGDIMAIESLPQKKHAYSAMAITESVLCLIPFKGLLNEAGQSPHLLQRLLSIMSDKMQNDRSIRLVTSAKQRVASFLLNMQCRAEKRGQSLEDVLLPLSQFDMSNLLGLAYETVSRILHEFERRHLIVINNKQIFIENIQGLKKIEGSYVSARGPSKKKVSSLK